MQNKFEILKEFLVSGKSVKEYAIEKNYRYTELTNWLDKDYRFLCARKTINIKNHIKDAGSDRYRGVTHLKRYRKEWIKIIEEYEKTLLSNEADTTNHKIDNRKLGEISVNEFIRIINNLIDIRAHRNYF